MDSDTNVLFTAAGFPALVSTGITIIYFVLKFLHYLFDAESHKTEGRVAAPTSNNCQQEYSPDKGTQGSKQICAQISGGNTEQYGRGTQRPSGSILLSTRGQDLCLPSPRDAAGYQGQSLIRENDERLQGGRNQNTRQYDGQGPDNTPAYSAGISTECTGGDHASNGQSCISQTIGRKGDTQRPDEIHDDGVSRRPAATTAQNACTAKPEVSSIALQTDTCDTLYVTKNTLIAYTIAIIQNVQVLQYDQMHIALQTARNQASLEMPIRGEELMSAHFNLALISNETNNSQSIDAQKSETAVPDASASASFPNKETYIKIPSHQHESSHDPPKQHPTGAVVPTCRREFGLVNGIPAGYESDDSWGHDSFTHQQECSHTHNIVPLLA